MLCVYFNFDFLDVYSRNFGCVLDMELTFCNAFTIKNKNQRQKYTGTFFCTLCSVSTLLLKV